MPVASQCNDSFNGATAKSSSHQKMVLAGWLLRAVWLAGWLL